MSGRNQIAGRLQVFWHNFSITVIVGVCCVSGRLWWSLSDGLYRTVSDTCWCWVQECSLPNMRLRGCTTHSTHSDGYDISGRCQTFHTDVDYQMKVLNVLKSEEILPTLLHSGISRSENFTIKWPLSHNVFPKMMFDVPFMYIKELTLLSEANILCSSVVYL